MVSAFADGTAPTYTNARVTATTPVSHEARRPFFSAQSFNDCFEFTLLQSSNTSVISASVDLSFRLNIDLASVSLSGGSLASETFLTPNDIDGYTFAGLQTGTYVIAATGNVSGNGTDSFPFGVGYGVGVSTTAPTVTPVPEPETMAMLALGLAVVTWGTRRKA